jgi:transposase
MDDASRLAPLPDDLDQLKAMIASRDQVIAQREATIAEREATIATLNSQRDEFYLKNLQLELRLAKALKQVYGPRADRIPDQAQLVLDFAKYLEAQPIHPEDLPMAAAEQQPTELPDPSSADADRQTARRLRTRGRRDIGSMSHLPIIEKEYELTEDLCLCPVCQKERQTIGSEVSYTIEHVRAHFLRIKHIQHKYACRHCEQNAENPNIELAPKTGASPIDKGMAGPGLLAYIATSKYADFLPLYRLEGIFQRQGFELDRATMCLWMGDVARIVRPVYDLMVKRVLLSHVIATDDTVMPLLWPGQAKPARMWAYLGDESHPHNVFQFTLSRSRDGPKLFLKDYRQVVLADGYGGYDAIVLANELPRAGCWAHSRRKFIEAEPAAPEVARMILRPIGELFAVEARAKPMTPQQRLALRQAESAPTLDRLHRLLLEQKAALLPKHPMALAINYALNQWTELTLFLTDPAIPIHNNLAEQQMKRIALLRKNALFVASENGGETAAILSSITSTCRRHGIDPQHYLTQLLTNMPDTPISQLEQWLPDVWKKSQPAA